MIEMLNCDCMEYMAALPDKAFDLAIVDPPYGGTKWVNNKRGRFGGVFKKYKIERTGGSWAKKYGENITHWDIPPDKNYFEELFRVSQNQIIWGGQLFYTSPCK